MKHHEEVKAAVARMVDNCQSCKDGDFCQECREDIKHLQEVNDFDVTEYVSKNVPEELTENTAGSEGDQS
jgi:hypothetical protein